MTRLSIIVNFHNMTREARRTLETLSRSYQRGIEDLSYEVIAVDNNSSQLIDLEQAKSLGLDLTYIRHQDESVSPSIAINAAVASARGDYVMVIIDGARMLSPGILAKVDRVIATFPEPFAYTMGMHLGSELQNLSMAKGYDQAVEDKLLATVDWRGDGYELFEISALAASARDGYFSAINESNCFAMRKEKFLELGGYDERFSARGGGLVNLAFFETVTSAPEIAPVLLFGEATFHQFHGGTATNVLMQDHPWKVFHDEYLQIKGRAFAQPDISPFYFGRMGPQARRLLSKPEAA